LFGVVARLLTLTPILEPYLDAPGLHIQHLCKSLAALWRWEALVHIVMLEHFLAIVLDLPAHTVASAF
jgi:hypothetical protein